jgi:hypothetical protein
LFERPEHLEILGTAIQRPLQLEQPRFQAHGEGRATAHCPFAVLEPPIRGAPTQGHKSLDLVDLGVDRTGKKVSLAKPSH